MGGNEKQVAEREKEVLAENEQLMIKQVDPRAMKNEQESSTALICWEEGCAALKLIVYDSSLIRNLSPNQSSSKMK